ncbi:bcl-2-related ovarian killer protein homolog B [Sinocyclocheilus anshuiensis]|uniref:Bcl-2-related ovarian killer protein homolog B n=1 Tax=Sinocyclocheilus anshuiensis TaxID=1608454 RepID=A0A671MVW1_9TELE|nr:PREDICTED: bcl-2-related ovarian killer protein homolog B [Sinocyclocheilus anshuiensis]
MLDLNVLERSSVFAAEMMMKEVFDRTPTEKELVSQSKELCRDFIHSRIVREGLSWSKVESDLPEPHGALVDISVVLLKLGDELECMRPYVYRNIAKQLNISVAVEAVVSDAFLSVATEILVMGITWGKVVAIYAVAAGLAVDCVRQGHPVMVHTIVDSLGEFVRRNLVPWLKKRGGWGDILKCVVNMDSRARAHWLSTAVFSWRQFLKTMYIYLTK